MTQAAQTEELKKRFIQFLHENKAHTPFLNGLKNARGEDGGLSMEEYLTKGEPSVLRYLTSAFIWMETPEGHFFWSSLNKKWKIFCGINN